MEWQIRVFGVCLNVLCIMGLDCPSCFGFLYGRVVGVLVAGLITLW